VSIVRKGRAEKWLEMREKSGIEQWKKAFGVKERAFGVKKSGDRWWPSRGRLSCWKRGIKGNICYYTRAQFFSPMVAIFS
jgi:hypothetical protein